MFKSKVESKCEHKDYCDCNENHLSCEKCKWYKMIDAGYGYCMGLPKVEVVPWCKITCSLFIEVINN
jgi:hypothetical protein